jgi:membrane-associated protease RseP (regulator of RpoE activity)
MPLASETLATSAIALAALVILGWGFYRARPFGRLGILAWLQSVALMLPWLAFFVLFAVGIYLNLAGILLVLALSTGLYIVLGNRLRAAARDLPPPIAPTLPHPEASPEAESAAPEGAAMPIATAPGQPVAIPADDLKAIQGLFGIDTFFITETIPYQEGAILKGNLRGEPAKIHATLNLKLQERLGDRYRLFLVEGPEERPTFVVLPSSTDPKPTSMGQNIFAVGLMVATVATCFESAGLLQGFDLFTSPERYLEALPIAAGLLAVLGLHELGHQIMARKLNVKLSLPFFLPVWQIGSFGAFNRFESLLPNRQALCDIALAGPVVGGSLSLLMLLVGLELSVPGSQFQIPSEFFQGSILVGTLAKLVMGAKLQQAVVDIHPLVAIGWLGLAITAINLMPAGQLDGGRIVQAIYGRKTARRTTVGTIILLALASFATPLALYWALVIAFLVRDLERPALEELSEPDDARAALGLLMLFLMVATLLPLTPSLAGRLGIGG